MTIEQMDRQAAKVLSAALREVVELVAAEHGLDFRIRGGSFSPYSGTYKPSIEFSVPSVAVAVAQKDASLVGLPDDAIGRSFTHQGREYTITGINLRARRMPVQATRTSDERTFKFPTATVKHALETS